MKLSKIVLISLTVIIGLLWISYQTFFKSRQHELEYQVPIASVLKRSYAIDVHTVGELEAASSISISSSIRGDQGKLIWLISDGAYVKPGELLIRMDPTPFEEKIE